LNLAFLEKRLQYNPDNVNFTALITQRLCLLMQRNLSFLLFTASLLLAINATAQLQIAFPASRAVYQRNNANSAVVAISGTYTVLGNRVDARALARVAGQGTSTDWQTIVANAQGGVYGGSLTLQGGWYDIEVRLMRDGQQVALTKSSA
jgi:hypothetical protein